MRKECTDFVCCVFIVASLIAIAILTGCASGGKNGNGGLGVGPTGLDAPTKPFANQSVFYSDASPTHTVVMMYSDNGDSLNTAIATLSGAVLGFKYGGAPGAVVGGGAGAAVGMLSKAKPTSTTLQRGANLLNQQALPAVK